MFSMITLVEETCCNCGQQFAMQENFRQMRLKDGKLFYCPTGHAQHYTGRQDELDRLKKKNQQLETSLSWKAQSLERITDELNNTKKQKAAIKGQLTKTRKRVANGVCPCCHRTFPNVARHMTSKHPDFKESMS